LSQRVLPPKRSLLKSPKVGPLSLPSTRTRVHPLCRFPPIRRRLAEFPALSPFGVRKKGAPFSFFLCFSRKLITRQLFLIRPPPPFFFSGIGGELWSGLPLFPAQENRNQLGLEASPLLLSFLRHRIEGDPILLFFPLSRRFHTAASTRLGPFFFFHRRQTWLASSKGDQVISSFSSSLPFFSLFQQNFH